MLNFFHSGMATFAGTGISFSDTKPDPDLRAISVTLGTTWHLIAASHVQSQL